MDDFSVFLKKLGLWVFLVHPTVVSVLLSASVERCFVSRMQDFLEIFRLDSFNLKYGTNKTSVNESSYAMRVFIGHIEEKTTVNRLNRVVK